MEENSGKSDGAEQISRRLNPHQEITSVALRPALERHLLNKLQYRGEYEGFPESHSALKEEYFPLK